MKEVRFLSCLVVDLLDQRREVVTTTCLSSTVLLLWREQDGTALTICLSWWQTQLLDRGIDHKEEPTMSLPTLARLRRQKISAILSSPSIPATRIPVCGEFI